MSKRIKNVSSISEGSLFVHEEEASFKDYLREVYRHVIEKATDFKFDTSGEEGIVTFKVPKETIKQFEDYILEDKERQEYLRRCIELKDRIGTRAVDYLCSIKEIDTVTFDKFVELLPSKELILKDADTYGWAKTVSCGYYSTDEGMLSLQIPIRMALGESIIDYPEQLQYHYYWYPSDDKKVMDAPFTKSELLESIELEKTRKKIIRKK